MPSVNNSAETSPSRGANPTLTATGRQMTGAEAVAQIIAAQPAPSVYGIPGGSTMSIFDALYPLQDKIDIKLVRQESVATVMAEARGRLTGTPAFVLAQGAWVLGNAGIGIMEAHLGSSPMVILIDGTEGGHYSHLGPYQGGMGGYGAFDLPAAMRAITKQVFVANDPTQALQMTQLAVKHAVTGEPGPVAVIFHSRALSASIDPETQPRSYPDASYSPTFLPTAAQSAIDAASELMATSSRPAIISGNGVRLAKAEAEVQRFAEALDAPVATTPAGKGTFPENHPLAVGVIGGFGHEAANSVVGEADLLIAVGTKLGATDTAMQHPDLIDVSRQKLIQIDVEPLNVSWTYPADVAVVGDAGEALSRLASVKLPKVENGHSRAESARNTHGGFNEELTSDSSGMRPREVVRALSRTTPEGTIVTCDAGENRLFVLRDFQTTPGGTVLQPNGGGGMGYAIPAAIGSALAYPEKHVVAVCGDGGFAMSLHSLVSAVETGVKVTVLVLDNGVLGWVRSGQRGRVVASAFDPVDFVTIATGAGAHAEEVHTISEAEAALVSAAQRAGVSVIVAKVSTADRYQDVMSSLNTHDVYAVPEIHGK